MADRWDVRDIVEQDLPSLTRRLFERDVAAVTTAIDGALGETMRGAARAYTGALRELIEQAEACLLLLARSADERRLHAARYAALQEGLAAATTLAERSDLLLDFLALISPPGSAEGDRAAVRRALGFDAVTERYLRLQERLARREEILLTATTAALRRAARNLVHQAIADLAATGGSGEVAFAPPPGEGPRAWDAGARARGRAHGREDGDGYGDGDGDAEADAQGAGPAGPGARAGAAAAGADLGEPARGAADAEGKRSADHVASADGAVPPVHRAAARAAAATEAIELFHRLGAGAALLEQARGAPRWQNRVAALRALGRFADALPRAYRGRLLGTDARSAIIRMALDRDEPVWVQRQALELLVRLGPQEALELLENRLLRPGAPDGDIFVRARAVQLLVDAGDERRALAVIRRVLDRPEPSELVRMEAVRALAALRGLDAERLLLQAVRGDKRLRDPSPRVRIIVAELWRKKAALDRAHEEIAARTLAWLVQHDDDFLVRRAAIEECALLAAERQARQRRYKIDPVDFILVQALDSTIRHDPDVRVKRLCQDAREAIVVRTFAAFDWVESRIVQPLDALGEQGEMRIAARDMAVPEDLLGRVLAYFTRRSFPIAVERRGETYVVRRGDRFGWRLWRVLHEVRNPDPAKRQAHRHTVGRVVRGHLRAPPGLLAELVETKVPGERLWNGQELSWRRFLPTVDDYMSAFSWWPWRRQRSIRVFSSEGTAEIIDRRSWWRALGAHLRMAWRYRELAQRRNGGPHDRRYSERAAFLRTMRDELGLETVFTPHEARYEGRLYRAEDPTIAEHFAFGAFADSVRARPVPETATRELEAGLASRAASQAASTAAGDDTAGAGEGAAGLDDDAAAGLALAAEGASERTLDELLRPLLAEAGTGEMSLSQRSGSGSGAGFDATEDDDEGDDLDPMVRSAAYTPAPGLGPDDTHPELLAPGAREGAQAGGRDDGGADADAEADAALPAAGRPRLTEAEMRLDETWEGEASPAPGATGTASAASERAGEHPSRSAPIEGRGSVEGPPSERPVEARSLADTAESASGRTGEAALRSLDETDEQEAAGQSGARKARDLDETAEEPRRGGPARGARAGGGADQGGALAGVEGSGEAFGAAVGDEETGDVSLRLGASASASASVASARPRFADGDEPGEASARLGASASASASAASVRPRFADGDETGEASARLGASASASASAASARPRFADGDETGEASAALAEPSAADAAARGAAREPSAGATGESA